MGRITGDDKVVETFENKDYSITFVQPHAQSIKRGYMVQDKISGDKFALLMDMKEECANIDGRVDLIFAKGKQKTELDAILDSSYYDFSKATKSEGEHLSVIRPKGEDCEWNTPVVGDVRHKENDLWILSPSTDGLMSVYKGLQDNLFKEHGQQETTDKSKNVSQEILSFLDKYIFNTDESREVLNEYLKKNERNASSNDGKKTETKKHLNSENKIFSMIKSKLGRKL